MCHHLTILAHAGDHRAVAQCEHGALHVSWDIATVRLRPHDFLTLAQFLARSGLRADIPAISEGWCHLARDERGSARLWIGQAGLALAAADLPRFVALVGRAAALLRGAVTQRDEQQPTLG
jgi:hypothetical protein